MPIVRVDPPRREKNSFFSGLKRLGAFASMPIPTLIQSVQDIHAPREGGRFFPTELDTETGQVTIERPKKGKGLLGRYTSRLGPLSHELRLSWKRRCAVAQLFLAWLAGIVTWRNCC